MRANGRIRNFPCGLAGAALRRPAWVNLEVCGAENANGAVLVTLEHAATDFESCPQESCVGFIGTQVVELRQSAFILAEPWQDIW